MPSPEAENEMKPRGIDGARLFLILGVSLPLSMAAGIGIGLAVFGKEASPAPAASAICPPPPPAPSAKEPETIVEKAEAGDFQALDALKAKVADTRTPAETLALARGRSGNKSRALEGFAAEIRKKPELLSEKDPRDRLREFFTSRETTNQAAGVIVEQAGTLGPDLLYDVVASTKVRNETVELALELLATKELRAKASPALLVALDLRKATLCEEFKDLLPRAAETGDRRSIPLLLKLSNKRGCGEKKLDDCWECLRELEKDKEAIDLGDAVSGARKRQAPKL